ncbi:TPA: hypothetical protein DE059_04550 [Candidatus Peribacteria bacterium]|jgi:hypothetical protein|nr:hypothetical protein [Candidatus Peribacteria bacterium]|tara:strand:- start:187 stop:912 length:726 start_codon:yes stop_codon:yes gene_type:complete
MVEGDKQLPESSDGLRKIESGLEDNRAKYRARIEELASDADLRKELEQLERAIDNVLQIIEQLKTQAGADNKHDVSSLDSIKRYIEKYLQPYLFDYGDERHKNFHVKFANSGAIAMGNDGDLYNEFHVMKHYASLVSTELDTSDLIDVIISCEEIYEKIRAFKLKHDKEIWRFGDEYLKLINAKARAEQGSDEESGRYGDEGDGAETVDSRTGKVVHPNTPEWDWLARRNLLAFRSRRKAS